MAGKNDLGTFKIPFEASVHHGQGVRLLTGLTSDQNAFEVCDISIINRSIGALKQVHEVSTSQTEYTKTQEMNLEGEGSKNTLKVGGGLDIMLKESVTTKSVICISKGNILTGSDKYDPAKVKLTEGAKAALRSGPENFISLYGTHFVGGFDIGALFSSVTIVETKSTSDKTKIGTKLSGAYEGITTSGKASGKGSGKYGLDAETSELVSNLKGHIYSAGVKVKADFDNLDVLAKEFANFSENASQNSTQIATYCYPYTALSEVTDILRETGNEGEFTPPIKHSLIDSICREARDTQRSISRIASMDKIAEDIPKAENVSRKYRDKLEQEMDFYRGLTLEELSEPSDDLLKKIGKQPGYEEISSKASEYYQDWAKEFKAAYEDII